MILRDGVTHGDSLGDFRDAYFPGVFTPIDGVQNDGINYWEYETSASAIEQVNTAFNGHYEIVPDVEAFVEAGYSNRHSVGFLAPSYVDGNIIVGADSSTNPFGRDLTRSEEHTSELQSLMRISYAVL